VVKTKKSLHATKGHPVGITDVSLAALGWWKVIRESVTINFKKLISLILANSRSIQQQKNPQAANPSKSPLFRCQEGMSRLFAYIGWSKELRARF